MSTGPGRSARLTGSAPCSRSSTPGPGYQGAVTRVVSLNQACPAKPFLVTYQGVSVECAKFGEDYAKGQVVPIRGDGAEHPGAGCSAPLPRIGTIWPLE